VLLSRASGLAEVVIPMRSKMIAQSVFPGMTTEDGGLMVLAIQRGGTEMGHEPVVLCAGDHLLLQGTWKALDQYLSDPKVAVVDSPEVVQKQAVALGPGAHAAIAILLLLVVLLAFDLLLAADCQYLVLERDLDIFALEPRHFRCDHNLLLGFGYVDPGNKVWPGLPCRARA